MEVQKNNENSPFTDANMSKLVSYCPFCSTSFTPEKASVVGESKESWLLHINCDHCASSIVLLLLVGEVGISSFGLVTDLTVKDVDRFHKSERIVSDDLINLYEMLYKRTENFIAAI